MKNSEKGQTVVEYILMLALVSLIVLTARPFIQGILWKNSDGTGAGVMDNARTNLGDNHLKNGALWK